MGWASAGEIFDKVADGLIAAHASDEIKISVLCDLIGFLQEGDWDTEYESLDKYTDDPVIVEAFRQHRIEYEDDDIEPGSPGSPYRAPFDGA